MDNRLTTSRVNFEKLGAVYEQAKNVTIEKEIIESISCYWFYKGGFRYGRKIIIYLHGGCFVLGSIYSHQAMVSHLADRLDIPILFIEYSLAPENPFPEAINDILKVYQHIASINKIQDITIMGDSAGAGLSISVISFLEKMNIMKPKRLIMISPWVDLSCTGDSIIKNAEIDPILTKVQLQYFTSLYLESNNIMEANPIEMMTGVFPPTLILVGSNEILLDDSRVAYSKISILQPGTKMKIYDNQTHVWLLDDIQSEASKDAIREIEQFISI